MDVEASTSDSDELKQRFRCFYKLLDVQTASIIIATLELVYFSYEVSQFIHQFVIFHKQILCFRFYTYIATKASVISLHDG